MKRLRIGFPLSRGGGGPTIFMRRLREEVRNQELALSTYFFNPLADILICSNAVRNPWHKPYLMRLDGIVFDSALGDEEINRRNSPIFRGIDGAVGLIFQADFCKRLISNHYEWGEIKNTVIPNGVDLNVFNPEGPNMRQKLGLSIDDLVFISSAKWRAHKRLDSILSSFDAYCRKYEVKAHLLVLGQIDSQPLGATENVHFIGHVEEVQLPKWYRTADVCLFFSWLDHCPNTVIEAIATGLPVLCTNLGGTRELIERANAGLVAEVDQEYKMGKIELYRPPIPDQEVLLNSMATIVQNKDAFRNSMHRDKVGISAVAKQYVEFAGSCIS